MHKEVMEIVIPVCVNTIIFRPSTRWTQGSLGPHCETAQVHLLY